MIVIGLVLMLAALGAGAWLFLASQTVAQATDLSQWGVTVGFTPLALLITGAGITIAFLSGLSLVRFTIRRRSRRRKSLKEAELLAAAQRADAEQATTRRLESEQGRLARFTDPMPTSPSDEVTGQFSGHVPPPPARLG